jgi:hypothetical protein
MSREADGQGRQLPWPSEAIAPGADANGLSIVPYGAVDPRSTQFGRPSSYSLPVAVLAAHVRDLRRSGWQSWEIRARFDFRRAA